MTENTESDAARGLPKDLQEYLPLSQRPRVDESAVTGDWAGDLGDTLFAIAALVETLDERDWEGASSLPPASVAAVVTDAVDRLERPRWRRLPRRPQQTLVRDDAIDLLRELSARTGRRSVRELTIGIVCAFDVAAATGTSIEVDPLAAGAVALARATAAPLPIRTVLRSRRLCAIDAGWHVGSGEVVTATASAIVLFLHGRGPLPTSQSTSQPTPSA